MNELDAFEKSIKAELEGFDQIKPSKMLWLKINIALLFKWLTGPQVLLSSIIGMVILFSLGWLFSTDIVFRTDNMGQIQESSTQKQAGVAQPSILNNTDEIDNTKEIFGNSKTFAQANSSRNNNPLKADKQINKNKSFISNKTNKSNRSFETTTNNPNQILNKHLVEKHHLEKSNISISKDYASTQEKTPIQNSNLNQESPFALVVETTNQKQREMEIILKWKLLPYLPKLNTSFPISDYRTPTISYIRPLWMEYEAYIGSGLTQSEFIFTTDQTPVKSLTTSYHIGGSAMANYQHWFVRSGLDYNKISQEFPYESNVTTYDSTTYYYTVFHNTYVVTTQQGLNFD